MCKSVTVLSLFLAFGAISLVWSAPDDKKKPTTEASVANDQARVAEIRAKLAKPITSAPIENVSLREALEALANQSDLAILVNTMAFKTHLQTDSIEDSPVRVPKLTGVRLSTALRKILAQVQGTYLIHPDHIEVTTFMAATPEVWTVEGQRSPHVPQVVDVSFDHKPLEDALKELATLSGINIVLDPRVSSSSKTSITATMDNAPLDTAVRLIADMAGLKTRAMDNVIYVTTPENVEALLQEDEQQMDDNRPKRRFNLGGAAAGMQ